MFTLAPRLAAMRAAGAAAAASSSRAAVASRSLHLASRAPRRAAAAVVAPTMQQRRTLASEAPLSGTYTSLTAEHIPELAALLSTPATSLLTTLKPARECGVTPVDASELVAFNHDWMNKYKGRSACVVKPKSTEEVAAVVKYCAEQRIAVVPQGGNTGLVGGGVPVYDEVVISLSSLNKIRSFDAVSGTLVADAGCILEVLDNHVAEHGYMMPLDLGAKGSCHIGGNVATNAGGLRFLRYGSLHGNVLGLEVVLPDGRVLDGLSTLRKDNTGFDLKQLFIGSEGAIGLITGVSIITPRRPSAFNVAVFGLPSFEAIQTLFPRVKAHLGEVLSAFEYFDAASMTLVKGHASQPVRDPFEAKHPFYVLIETGGSNKEHDDAKLQSLLEDLMENELINDGVLAENETQIAGLWTLREAIPEAANRAGAVYKYDLSMPVDKMNELVEVLRNRFEEQGLLGEDKMIRHVVGYGHIGDGNVHINVVADKFTPEAEGQLEPFIYEWVSKVAGSISAEHGLGRMKGEKIGYSKSDVSVELMQSIKKMLDPHRIMNPGKYLPGA